MSVQVVYKSSKKIANSKIQAIFTSENFTMSEINSLSKVETSKLKKLTNLKKFNSDNIFHINLDDKIIVLIPLFNNHLLSVSFSPWVKGCLAFSI